MRQEQPQTLPRFQIESHLGGIKSCEGHFFWKRAFGLKGLSFFNALLDNLLGLFLRAMRTLPMRQ
jgi:hypothetical protein